MRKKLFYPVFILLTISFFGLISCVKQDFDEPPTRQIPVGELITIADLRAMYQNEAVLIDTAVSVTGIVVGDETSGNIYKNSYVYDGTSAINLRLRESGGLYVGDSIRIYLEGLMLTNYAGVIQLDSVDVDLNITKLKTNVSVEPKLVTIPELATNNYQSMLVKLENVQFVSTDTVKTWSDAVELTTQNRYLQDCDLNAVIVRTSGYANFADQPIPKGKGTFIAIVSIFNTDIQLYVRDVTEINLTGERCEGGGGGFPEPNITIPELKLLYEGQRLQITDDLVIGARVVANDESGNYYKTIVIQDEEGGIEMKINDYDLFNAFPLGQEIFIKCKDLYLDTYGGVIQLGSIYESGGQWLFGGIQPAVLGNYVVFGTSVEPVQPTLVNIGGLNDSKLGMLIQMDEVQFVEAELGTTWADPVNHYSVNHTLENCDATTIVVRTSGYADFAGENLPEGNGTIVGILSAYNGDFQLYVRQLADVALTGERCETGGGGGGGGDPVTSIDEGFDTQSPDVNINIEGWLNEATEGSRYWRGKTFSGNTYAQATAYQSLDPSNVTWLITPPIALDQINNPKLNFQSSVAYYTHDGFSVWISSDFDGTNIDDATWEEIDCNLAGSSTPNYDWVDSGIINLSSYTGNVYIGFRYQGSGPSGQTGTFIIDDVKVYGD